MIHVGKNLKKALAYIAILTGILSGAAFVYAQFSEGNYLVKTVHIFPSQIEAKGWNNASTLSFQNLDEYALLQEFNSINSATMNLRAGVSLELDKQQPADDTDDAAKETPAAVDEIITDGPADTESNSASETAESTTTATTTATTTEVKFDVVVDEEVPSETAHTQITSSTEPESVQSDPKEIEQTIDSDTSSTTVMRLARSTFRLAVTTVTSLFDTATNTPASESTSQSTAQTPSEPASTTQTQPTSEETDSSASSTEQNQTPVSSSTEPVQTTATTTSDKATSTPETPVVESEPVDESIQSSSTSASEPEPEPEQTIETAVEQPATECTEDCKPYVITLADFGYPLGESTEVSGAQLRMSFAAQKKSYRDRIPAFEMRYSMDNGLTWSAGGSVIIEDEVSNSINGGYFLFALPEVSGEADLDLLQVELSYRDDPTVLTELYVESVWLELFTLEKSGDNAGPLSFADTLLNDGFDTEMLNGDSLELPNGKVVDFDFTDENVDETLIIRSDKADYVGLTKTTTYFSVTNESNRADDFTLQTYFPRGVGEVKNIREYEKNKPREVVIPEYRPFVYHCEAGWDFAGEVTAGSLQELSQQLVPKVEESKETADPDSSETTGETTQETAKSTSSVNESSATSSAVEEETSPVEAGIPEVKEAEENVEFDLVSPEENQTEFDEVPDFAPTNTTTTVFRRLPSVQRLLQVSTTTPVSTTTDEVASEDEEESDETLVNSYSCRNTNVVRTCDSIEGDNTACRIENKKVAEHVVTNYAPGWTPVEVATGTMPKLGFVKRTLQFIGFGPDKKAVGEGFEVQSHSNNEYTIQPGETKYFEMEVSFPPFSSGEYWIEAIGDKEYGLLDPFWSSQWRYKKPITIDNLNGATSTEQQIFVELDAAETDFWSNVKSDGGDIRFVSETPGDSSATWYDQNWSRRTPFIIDASTIDGDLTNFPVYVNLSDLGAEFFTKVRADGSDIRITSGDKVTELPYELVGINKEAKTGELHFKADFVSSTTDSTFYIYYDNGAASAYLPGDTYGARNVWGSEFQAVYHLEEDSAGSGNAGLYKDATTNAYDADDEVTSTGKLGKMGNGQEIRSRETDPDDHIMFPSTMVNGEDELTFSFWFDTNQNGDQAIFSGGPNNQILFFLRNTSIAIYSGGNITFNLDANVTGTGWNHMVIIRDGINNQWRLFVNGVEDNQSPISYTLNPMSIPTDCLMIGGEHDTCASAWAQPQEYDGYVDEFQVLNTSVSPAWVAATYGNQNDTTSFYSTSTAETFTSTNFTELDYWLQHFDHDQQEADIWVQLEELAGGATSTVYIYYGNATADSTSDEYAPFTYSTSTDLYYVVNDRGSNPLVVYSYIDDNQVAIDGGTPVTLQAGETTSFGTYSSSSVISALGPIVSLGSDSKTDELVPISFATTTNLVTTERGTENFHVLSPFSTANVEMFAGADIVPSASGTILPNVATKYSFSLSGKFGVIESDKPLLLFYEGGTRDAYAAYPPTLRDIYGIDSSNYNYSSVADATSVDIYCSSGASTTVSGIARGSMQKNNACTGGSAGTGNAVRLANQTAPIAATQEADGGGSDGSRFLPTPEFATEYILAQDAKYVAIACAPRFGAVDVEIQDTIGDVVNSGTCTPGAETPGALNFNDVAAYAQGYKVVATNDTPFYLYFDRNSGGEEANAWGSVQAKKFNALYYTTVIGAEEENEDAQYEQLNYRWYENIDDITPTTPWDLGGAPITEGVKIADQGSVNPGDELRLRMSLMANNGTGTVDSSAFVLQYAKAATCSSVTGNSWSDLGDTGSTTAAFSGLNNTSVGDGTLLPSTLLSNSDVTASYEEENISATLPNEVANGQVVEFDWSITPVNTAANSEYCFRMIRSMGTVLSEYTTFPQVMTAGPPEMPNTVKRFDNEHASSTLPLLRFAAVDQGSDDLDYQVQISTDNTFSSTFIDRRSDVSFFDFENVNNSSDKSPFENGQLIEFTPPSALTNGVTYWWRVRALDPGGSNSFGAWAKAQSFTINTEVNVSEWFQTSDEQFETNSLDNATTSGSGSVELAIAGSNLIGEYGKINMTNGATSTVTLDHSYTNPVVVASVRYSRSVPGGEQVAARVFNKTSTSFAVVTKDFDNTETGTSIVDYVVMEAGDYLIDDGGDGLRVYATSTSVSAYAGSAIPTNPGGR